MNDKSKSGRYTIEFDPDADTITLRAAPKEFNKLIETLLVFASIPSNYRKTRAFPSPSCGGAVFVLERQNVGKPAEIRAFLALAWPSTTRHKTRTTPSQTKSARPEKGTAQHLVLPTVTGTDVGAPSVPNSWVRAPICQLARKRSVPASSRIGRSRRTATARCGSLRWPRPPG
jgi:hypothetical protein